MSSSALAAGIHLLRCKLAAQQPGEDSDEQLLHAFTSRRDDSAFAALMHRHGPMVLRVCRRVLGHEQDAEDALQATFLVLAQSAVALRNKTTLASFLHGTAYRTAMKAKQTAARRRKYEKQTPARPSADPAEELSWREVQARLDEEIDRLPETYRSVFVLCQLEGLSREETAQRLGLKEGTVSSRLTTARKRLAKELARHGVELASVLAAMGLTGPSASALPLELMATTIKAALAIAAGEKLASLVSASVAQLVKSATAAMAVSKAKTAMVLLLTGSLLGGVGVWVSAKPYVALSPSEQPRAVQVKDKPATPLQSKAVESLEIQGQVLDPEGKPKAGAKLFLRRIGDTPEPLGVSAADGRFGFTVSKSKAKKWITVVATADGYGLDWAELVPRDKKDKLILQLGKDSPIMRYSQQDGSFRVLGLPGPGVLAVQYSDRYLLANQREDAEGTKEEHLATEPHAVSAISYNAFARIDPPKGSDSVKRDVTLDPGQTITGMILDPDGRPLAGARSHGQTPWDFFGHSAMTSAQFTVRGFNPHRPRPVLFLHPEKKLVGTLEPPKDESARVTVKLMPGATVTGRLVDTDGQPRGRAELDLYFQQKNGSFAHYFPERITTGADGRFRIDALLPNYDFHLRETKGYFTFGGLRSGETKDLGDVQTQRSGE